MKKPFYQRMQSVPVEKKCPGHREPLRGGDYLPCKKSLVTMVSWHVENKVVFFLPSL